MKKTGYLLLLALVTVSANAKTKIVPLAESTASTLEGKSLAAFGLAGHDSSGDGRKHPVCAPFEARAVPPQGRDWGFFKL